MEYTKITENIFQIADDDGVYCTLIKGSDLAVLVDTGFGKQPLKEFAESMINTDYIVVNTHGHPDHISGNGSFDTIYASSIEFDMIRSTYEEFTGKKPEFTLKSLESGQILDLGDIKLRVVPLAGHTEGSIGLLLEKERLLIAGDAMNPCLWMFTPGAASIPRLIETLKEADKLPFDRYIFAHCDVPLPHGYVRTIIKNAEALEIDPDSDETIMGIECCKCRYTDEYGESVIVVRKP